MARKESKLMRGGTLKAPSGTSPVLGPMAMLVGGESAQSASKRALWSKQQLMAWLEHSSLESFANVFNDTTPDSRWTRHEGNDNMLQVKSGSVSHLVELLTTDRQSAMADVFDLDSFTRDFFMTYTSFCPPKELLNQLKARLDTIWEDSDSKDFDSDTAADNTKALVRILTIWVSIEDAACFAKDPELLKNTTKWIDTTLKSHTDDNTANSLHKMLEATVQLFNTPTPEPDPKSAPIPTLKKKDGGTGVLEIVDIDPEELARQMTLMESNIVRKVCTYEFQKTAWTKRNATEIAPNLTKAIEISNHFANWMITEILKQKSFEHMSELIAKLIKLGKSFQAIHNYSGVLQVVTALSNSAVSKLKSAWALIPAKSKDMLAFEELSDLVSPLGHYKKYRDAFASRPANEPCLPILATTLSDLNGYEEVFNATTADGAVNWAKMARVSGRIWEVVSLNVNYDYKPIPYIQNFVKEGAAWTDNLTTCAIADLRNREINKMMDAVKSDKEKRSSSKRKSSASLGDSDAGPRDELTDRDWQLLATGAGPAKIFSPGQVVLAAGSPNDSLFRIKRGTVRVIKEVQDQLVQVATMGEGAMFGEVSMLLRSQKEGTATASIIAEDECEVIILDIDVVMSLLASKPALAEKLHRILAIKLARRLRDLGKKSGTLTMASSTDVKAVQAATNMVTPAKKEDDKAKKSNDPNAKFNRRFGLEGEAIFKSFECSIRKPDEDKPAHGTMFVTQNFLCFDVTLFGLKKRYAFAFSQISDWKKKTKANVTSIHATVNTQDDDGNTSPIEWIIGHLENTEETHTFIASIWKHQQSAPKKEIKATITKATPSSSGEGEGAVSWLPSQEDWDLILKGARITNFKKDDVVMKEGDGTTRVYQLVRGECRFEKLIDGQNRVLGKMGIDGSGGALFGEISFLEGGKASASVVCDKDDTQIAIIEGYWLDVLFQYHPELSGRFYHYLANVLSKRLKQRESAAASAPALPSSSSSNSLISSSEEHKKDRKKRDKKDKKRKSESRPDEESTEATADVGSAETEE